MQTDESAATDVREGLGYVLRDPERRGLLLLLAAVSLAGIGADRTRIRILAVPGLKRNCHDIEVEGEFGRLAVHVENVPSENPRTGRLTALSIIRSIQDVIDPVRIGT